MQLTRTFLFLVFCLLIGCVQTSVARASQLLNSSTLLSFSASLPSSTISIPDGLPDVVVFSMAQDPQGYLWFGTQSGVSRYDGYELRNFVAIEDDPTTLSSTAISSMTLDMQGNLWVGTWGGGLNRIDTANLTVEQVFVEVSEDGLQNLYVQSIFEDKRGDIWIGTSGGGLYRYLLSEERMEHFTHSVEGGLSNNRIWTVEEDDIGNIWVGTSNGLNRINLATKETTRYYQNVETPNSLPNNQIRTLKKLDSGQMLVGTRSGIVFYDPITEQFYPVFLNAEVYPPTERYSGIVNSFTEDTVKGQMWVGTESGLFLLDTNTRQFVNVRSRDTSNAFANVRVRDVFLDEYGTLWLATRGSGVIKINLNASLFNRLAEGTYVNALLPQEDDTYYFGSYLGLYKGKITNGDMPKPVHDKDDQPIKGVYSIVKAESGQIWVGTVNGLYRQITSSGEFGVLPETAGLEVRSMLIIGEHLYAGTNKGLINVDIPNESFSLLQNEDLSANLSDNDELFNSLYQDKSGRIWAGTKYGNLYRVFSESQTYRFEVSISKSSLHAIAQTSKDHLWIGADEGLFSFHIDKKKLLHFKSLNNLSGKSVNGIVVDDSNIIWLATRNGLSSFSIRENRFYNFGVADGLNVVAFNPGAAIRGPENTIYMGSQHGIVYFSPDTLSMTPPVPDIRIDSMVVSDKQIRIEPNELEQYELTLDYDYKMLTIAFSLVDLTSPEINQYRYKLEGFDDDWIMSGKQRIVTYTNLDPGVYRFVAEGANRAGKWSEQPLIIDLTVSPPWWMLWWVKISAIILFISLCILVYRYRVSRYIHEQTILENRIAERTQALEEANDKLRELSSKDFLTNLLNRRAFLERLEQEMSHIRRQDDKFCLALIDIDDFKHVNDTYGHEAGDKVLQNVARTFNTFTRKQDIVARWGGEEFIFLLPSTPLDQGMLAFEKVRRAVEELDFVVNGSALKVTATFGVVEVTPDCVLERSIVAADEALYTGKRSGKNQVVTAA